MGLSYITTRATGQIFLHIVNQRLYLCGHDKLKTTEPIFNINQNNLQPIVIFDVTILKYFCFINYFIYKSIMDFRVRIYLKHINIKFRYYFKLHNITSS